MDDLTELLKRIFDYHYAYESIGIKPPLFKLTPYEHKLFLNHLISTNVNYTPQFFGDLPTYFGVDFELVGKPVLFDGKHIRSDSGIEVK